MKVVIVKGKFTGKVVGTLVTITCMECAKSTDVYTMKAPVPGSSELTKASQQMGKGDERFKKSFKKSKEVVDKELTKADPNAMSTMIIAPVTINGRPGGCQPVCCFYCRQVGLIKIEAERPGTGPFGFQPRSLNEDREVHARRRVIITVIPLLALDYLVQNNLVSPSATVVCAGASLQCQGKRSTGSDSRPRQDAHQILRELSIGGTPLYQLVQSVSGLPKPIKDVVTYCHGVISHLDAAYNEADCLVEHAITVEMIDLGHLVLSGSLRRHSGKYDDIFARLLWGIVVARYKYAIDMAIIYADPGPLLNVLLFYRSIVVRIAEEGPPELISHSLADVCDSYQEELRYVL
jgi:hypothetical protein